VRKFRSALALLLAVLWVAALQIFVLQFIFQKMAGLEKITSDSELIGIYDMEISQFKEVLILYPDYTFLQKVTIKTTGKTYGSTGKWAYDSKSGDLSLGDGYFPADDSMYIQNTSDSMYIQHKGPGSGSTYGPALIFGRITLEIPDLCMFTKRQKSLRIQSKMNLWNLTDGITQNRKYFRYIFT